MKVLGSSKRAERGKWRMDVEEGGRQLTRTLIKNKVFISLFTGDPLLGSRVFHIDDVNPFWTVTEQS